MIDRFVKGLVIGRAPDSPISVLHSSNETSRLGGASNVAHNIAELDVKAQLVAVVGPDSPERQEMEMLLLKSGVEHDLVEDVCRITASRTSFVAENGQRLLRCDRFSKTSVSKSIENEVVKRAECHFTNGCVSVLVLADNGQGVLTPDVSRRLIQAAKHSKIVVVASPKGRHYSQYTGVDLITVNTHDLNTVTGLQVDTNELVVEAANVLLMSYKVKAVLVTRENAGMTLVRPEQEPLHINQNARGEQVVDVSGKGDRVLAILACCLASGDSTLAASETCCFAAGTAVGKSGTATISINELRAANAAVGDNTTTEHVSTLVKSWHEKGLRVGFTHGCFDILHRGHICMLEQAASTCDRLIVGINSDESVKRLKGQSRPICNIADRISVLQALDSVHAVVEFKETHVELIKAIKPDILFQGTDDKLDSVVGAKVVQSYNGQVVRTKREAEISVTTTSLIRRIIERNKFRSYH